MLTVYSGWSALNASATAARSASTQMVIGLLASCSAVSNPYGLSEPPGELVGPSGVSVPEQPATSSAMAAAAAVIPMEVPRALPLCKDMSFSLSARVDSVDDRATSRRHSGVNHTCDVLAISAASRRSSLNARANAGDKRLDL